MYNYSYEVSYLHIEGDNGDTTYRKHLLGACGLKKWDDSVIQIQDKIYQKFKNNKDMKKLLTKMIKQLQKLIKQYRNHLKKALIRPA